MKRVKLFVLMGAIAVSVGALFIFIYGKEDVYSQRRKEMVRGQIAARKITDKRVLKAMEEIPRHLFVLKRNRGRAYDDTALPIDEGQTISQPYIVALMTQHLNLKEGEKVLEIGTGSGYQAAVLTYLTDEIYSIEIIENLAKKSSDTLKSLGYNQVNTKWADGYFGWKEHAPFDAIIVTCAANHVPRPLLNQLREGGRFIIPLGSTRYFQSLTIITKVNGIPKTQHILDVVFVPMTGEAKKRKR